MTEIIFGMNCLISTTSFWLVLPKSFWNLIEEGFISYSEANHQVVVHYLYRPSLFTVCGLNLNSDMVLCSPSKAADLLMFWENKKTASLQAMHGLTMKTGKRTSICHN